MLGGGVASLGLPAGPRDPRLVMGTVLMGVTPSLRETMRSLAPAGVEIVGVGDADVDPTRAHEDAEGGGAGELAAAGAEGLEDEPAS